MPSAPDTSRISPTAHYTAYVWHRHGMSTPELATSKGRALYYVLQAANRALAMGGQADLESMLLARHRVIDFLLKEAIDDGRVGQIVEVAAGLSPRGLRMRRRHPEITYVEGDLPQMIDNKKRLIGGKLSEGHRLVGINALADSGPGSLDELADTLDTTRGVAVITEGLLPYFDGPTVSDIWRRIHSFMSRFSEGLYLSDYYLRRDSLRVVGVRPMSKLLGWFVDGGVHLSLQEESDLYAGLGQAGLSDVNIHMAGDFAQRLQIESPKRSAYVRVIEART
jgi:O-methyltransferase involved in polyketide biosynthesis